MAHTIKGGSAVVGITILSEYAYKLETLLDFSVENTLPKDLLDLLPNAASCLENLFDAVQSKNKEPQEFLEIFNKLSHYVENLDEYRNQNSNQENEEEELAELAPSALPDFIQSQNALSDSLEKDIEEELEAALQNATESNSESDNVNATTSTDTLEIIELPGESDNTLDRLESNESDDQLNDTHEMSLEIDDIVMTLASITATSEDVLDNADSYIR
ncbi:hypothetical protein GQR58_006869 [Nymphon striatum]|nr:hypothetical protein GQR58_006869 [Nymphon striatum]